MYHGDTAEVIQGIPDRSVDYSIFSPPFASLYTYSNSERDMGNCRNHAEFWQHYSFLAPELHRILGPGRLASVHCMNLPRSKERDGVIGLYDFRGDVIRRMEDAGFIYHSEVVIWKDPVTAMQRTKAIGLLYKQLRKDSTISRQGIADYLVTFRKRDKNDKPVTKTFESFPVGKWQEYASPVWNDIADEPFPRTRPKLSESEGWPLIEPDTMESRIRAGQFPPPVWMDIDATDTLTRTEVRENDDERHICALQLGVIERGIELWSNRKEVIFSPFAGIGSEGVVSIETERRFLGVELKGSYFEQACINLAQAESIGGSQSVLDLGSGSAA